MIERTRNRWGVKLPGVVLRIPVPVLVLSAVLAACSGPVGPETKQPAAAVAPTFDPPAGAYSQDVDVSISTTTPDATIYYTTDGDEPTSSSPVYTGPISVAGDGTALTIRAMAVAPEAPESAIAEASYSVNYQRVVTTANPTGPGSLSEMVSLVSDGGTITFDGDYTITQDTATSSFSWFSVIDRSITIDGENNDIVIDANTLGRHFFLNAGSVTLRNLTLANGRGLRRFGQEGGSAPDPGGAISASPQFGPSTVILENVTIRDSSSTGGSGNLFGGAIAIGSASRARIYTSVIRGNVTPGLGGGIYTEGDLTVASSALIANDAATGGAVATDSTQASSTLLLNVSLVANTQDTGASAELSVGSTTVDNSVFVGDTVVSRATVRNSVSASALPGGSGAGNIEADPLIVAGPTPGADGQYDGVDDDYGSVELQTGSPAIDAGSNALIVPDAGDVDQDGDTAEPLPWALEGDPRVQGSQVDAGAAER